MLAQLRALLREGDVGAADLWSTHEAALQAGLGSVRAAAVSRAIGDFDFEAALQQLADMPAV